jgi:hypothetical protein
VQILQEADAMGPLGNIVVLTAPTTGDIAKVEEILNADYVDKYESIETVYYIQCADLDTSKALAADLVSSEVNFLHFINYISDGSLICSSGIDGGLCTSIIDIMSASSL